jgi:hypothetical protein
MLELEGEMLCRSGVQDGLDQKVGKLVASATLHNLLVLNRTGKNLTTLGNVLFLKETDTFKGESKSNHLQDSGTSIVRLEMSLRLSRDSVLKLTR